jgi:hypothetical protein
MTLDHGQLERPDLESLLEGSLTGRSSKLFVLKQADLYLLREQLQAQGAA